MDDNPTVSRHRRTPGNNYILAHGAVPLGFD